MSKWLTHKQRTPRQRFTSSVRNMESHLIFSHEANRVFYAIDDKCYINGDPKCRFCTKFAAEIMFSAKLIMEKYDRGEPIS